MGKETITKEELIMTVSELNNANTAWKELDEDRRKEFAKAFHWQKKPKQYDYGDPEPHLPTWAEVFVELGKLLSLRDSRDYDGTISSLEVKLEELEKRIPLNN